jgi:nucleoside-diphosphate-sugar epimerase
VISSKVLVTGATGFVGEALVFRLLEDERFTPVAAMRDRAKLRVPCQLIIDDFDLLEALPELRGINVIVHTAARVHVLQETSEDALVEFRRVNVAGTLNLARQAAESGVKRFIFISSIKVNGERTLPGKPFTAVDIPAPMDPYGISKHEAEEGLRQLANKTGMEIVILRPPLIYGPGVKANFLSMLRWLDKGIPLPLGAINNQRSLVAIENLLDLIITCITCPAAANRTFLASDGEDISTTQLLLYLAKALNKKCWIIPVPHWVLRLVLIVFGQKHIAQRLCDSLQIDIKYTCDVLNWTPPVTMKTALKRTVRHYLNERSK